MSDATTSPTTPDTKPFMPTPDASGAAPSMLAPARARASRLRAATPCATAFIAMMVAGGLLKADDVDGPVLPPPMLTQVAPAVTWTPDDARKATRTTPRFPDSAAAAVFLGGRPHGAAFKSTLWAAQAASADKASTTSSTATSALAFKSLTSTTPTLLGTTEAAAADWFGGVTYGADCDGAAGDQQYVQVVRWRVLVYKKTNNQLQLVRTTNLSAFFGDSEGLDNPRVVYDTKWKRWIVVATRNSTSANDTVRRFRLAVSTTSDATGSYYIYNVFFNGSNGDYLDFPLVGMDQDAVIVTGDIFNPYNNWAFSGAMAASFPKADLYNGAGATGSFFYGLNTNTVAPPIVIDKNVGTFLLSAPQVLSNTTAILKYTLRDSSRSPATLLGPVQITVPGYSTPPSAPQPGTTTTLDTGWNAFTNHSPQVGNLIWQAHTVNIGGRAGVRWYSIDTNVNAVNSTGVLSASATSSDFNASIGANPNGDVFITWNSTDPAAGVNAQIRFSGKLASDSAISSGSVAFTSPTFYSTTTGAVARWSPYSSVSVDPGNPSTAWIVNEKINAQNAWGSGIGLISF
jgi:hypothetical protein